MKYFYLLYSRSIDQEHKSSFEFLSSNLPELPYQLISLLAVREVIKSTKSFVKHMKSHKRLKEKIVCIIICASRRTRAARDLKSTSALAK